jgi:hypothetical protein
VGCTRGYRAWVWDIILERFKLVPLYSIFLNSKEEDRITPRERKHIAKLRKLFVYVCDWCVAPQILIVLFLIYLFDNIIQLISLRSLWYYGGW